jgi:hypothetical protein
LCERRRGRRREVREGACIGAATILHPWTLRLILNCVHSDVTDRKSRTYPTIGRLDRPNPFVLKSFEHGGGGGRSRGDGIGDERAEAIERDGIAIARVWSGPIYPPHLCVCACTAVCVRVSGPPRHPPPARWRPEQASGSRRVSLLFSTCVRALTV